MILGGKSTIRFRNFDTLPMLNETVQRGAQIPYACFGDVIADFEERLDAQIPDDHGGKAEVTFPFFVASLDDCLEEASTTGVRYSIWGRIPSQMGNVADGLAAIKQFIFDEKSMTWEELNRATKTTLRAMNPSVKKS